MKRRDLLLGAPALWTGVAAGLPSLAFAQSTVIKLGQSASLTGAQARYGGDVRDGIAAALAGANRNDSKGLKFELVTLDDGGTRDRCVENVKKLIDDGASALIGLTSGAAAEACMPAIEKGQIAKRAPFTCAPVTTSNTSAWSAT
jgi:branched-chain amino acid transport system substrate-binding protein